MDFGQPFGGMLPGARGAALDVLLRTGSELTGRRVHALTQGSHSLGAIQQALRDLEQLGLTTSHDLGRASIHRINDTHILLEPLRSMRSPLELLRIVVSESSPDVDAVLVFGSVARGEAGVTSDVDLAVVAPETWDGRADLAQTVEERLGSACDVLHVRPAEITAASDDRDPVVEEILRDGVLLLGDLPRRLAADAS